MEGKRSSTVQEPIEYDELQVFKPICFILKLLGFQCHSEKSGWRGRTIWIVRRIPPIVYVAYTIFYVGVVTIGKVRNGGWINSHVATTTSFTIFQITSALSAVYLLRWGSIGVVRRLSILLSEATNQCGAKSRKRLMAYRAYVHVVAIILLVVGSAFFGFTAQSGLLTGRWSQIEIKIRGAVFGVSAFEYVTVVFVTYGCACWCLVSSIFTLCCVSVYEELKHFNGRLRMHETWTAESIQSFASTYSCLLKSMSYLDSVFANFLFVTLSADIANFVLLVYSLITSCCNESYFGYLWFGAIAIFLVLRSLGFSLAPAKIYEEASRSAAIITKVLDCDAVAADAELYRAASWFLKKINTQQLGISIGGFCVITKPLLLTVASVVVTYLILLVQMTLEAKTTTQNGTAIDS